MPQVSDLDTSFYLTHAQCPAFRFPQDRPRSSFNSFSRLRFSLWNAGRGGDYETLCKNGSLAGAEREKMILGLSRIVLFFASFFLACSATPVFFFLVSSSWSLTASPTCCLLDASAPATGCLRGCCKPVTTELATKLELSSPPPSCRPITALDGWCVDELAIWLGD